MTIATYSDLQTAVTSWIARDDSDFIGRVTDFISLFEAQANRRLRVRQQETTSSLTPSAGVATIPTDFLDWRRVTWTGSVPRELEYVHPSYLHALFPTRAAGTPRYFTIEGTSLTVAPSDNTVLTFDYFAKIPVLSNSNTTNWLLTASPDLYLFGSLSQAHGFEKNYEALAAWAARTEALFTEIESLDSKTRGPSAVRVIGLTP